MSKLRVIGMDPSLNNWGIASAEFCTESQGLRVNHIHVICPKVPTGKQVRQNSKDLTAAYQLSEPLGHFLGGANAVFVEVPVGSQSARAMASYGICVGILGSLRAQGLPFFELTPTEVKLAAVDNKTATKQQMIAWAMEQHPEAPWPTYPKNGETLVSEAKAEHMADAIAAIYAGINSDAFKQLMLFSR